MSDAISIHPLLPGHYPDVRCIYEEGMATGIATFETSAPNWLTWDEKFLPNCRFVALAENKVAAWAALTPYSKRAVYRGVAEVSLYVGAAFRGKGIGLKLLHHLVEASEQAGFWTLQAVIFAENTSSIRLHEKAGFRLVGIREKIGKRDGIWHDNVLMERRFRDEG